MSYSPGPTILYLLGMVRATKQSCWTTLLRRTHRGSDESVNVSVAPDAKFPGKFTEIDGTIVYISVDLLKQPGLHVTYCYSYRN